MEPRQLTIKEAMTLTTADATVEVAKARYEAAATRLAMAQGNVAQAQGEQRRVYEGMGLNPDLGYILSDEGLLSIDPDAPKAPAIISGPEAEAATADVPDDAAPEQDEA